MSSRVLLRTESDESLHSNEAIEQITPLPVSRHLSRSRITEDQSNSTLSSRSNDEYLEWARERKERAQKIKETRENRKKLSLLQKLDLTSLSSLEFEPPLWSSRMADVMAQSPKIGPEKTSLDDTDIPDNAPGFDRRLQAFMLADRARVGNDDSYVDETEYATSDGNTTLSPITPSTSSLNPTPSHHTRLFSPETSSSGRASVPKLPMIAITAEPEPGTPHDTSRSTSESTRLFASSSPRVNSPATVTTLCSSNESSQFGVLIEQITPIFSDVIETVVGTRAFDEAKATDWVNQITVQVVHRLAAKGWPFKYIVQTILLPENHGAFHMSSGCIWNVAADGSIKFTLRGKSSVEYVIIVFGVHIHE